QEELDRYREDYPGFAHELEVRDDVPDLMVSHGKLLIPAAANFRSGRVEPLIQHEVGTHVVTFANGSAQPLSLLTVGLPGYEETQEGLAVLAEYAVDGLEPQRLRLLAGRVLAVKRVIEGASFLDVFEELHEEHCFSAKTSWGVTIRVTRSGGLTKDVIYLRGISRVLEFVAERKDITPLLVGKLSLEHVPLVEELLESGFLKTPWIRARWLDMPVAKERLQRVFEGLSVTELLDREDVQ
ncbi:MAG: flavohemoglobin expression-modulating QEGLA motif protein, partial [Actinobacteria bacterium]|nr:flavohemoglobin expression-modulating QEGLA motif protein [Actinomycetota bacterium]